MRDGCLLQDSQVTHVTSSCEGAACVPAVAAASLEGTAVALLRSRLHWFALPLTRPCQRRPWEQVHATQWLETGRPYTRTAWHAWHGLPNLGSSTRRWCGASLLARTDDLPAAGGTESRSKQADTGTALTPQHGHARQDMLCRGGRAGGG